MNRLCDNGIYRHDWLEWSSDLPLAASVIMLHVHAIKMTLHDDMIHYVDAIIMKWIKCLFHKYHTSDPTGDTVSDGAIAEVATSLRHLNMGMPYEEIQVAIRRHSSKAPPYILQHYHEHSDHHQMYGLFSQKDLQYDKDTIQSLEPPEADTSETFDDIDLDDGNGNGNGDGEGGNKDTNIDKSNTKKKPKSIWYQTMHVLHRLEASKPRNRMIKLMYLKQHHQSQMRYILQLAKPIFKEHDTKENKFNLKSFQVLPPSSPPPFFPSLTTIFCCCSYGKLALTGNRPRIHYYHLPQTKLSIMRIRDRPLLHWHHYYHHYPTYILPTHHGHQLRNRIQNRLHHDHHHHQLYRHLLQHLLCSHPHHHPQRMVKRANVGIRKVMVGMTTRLSQR
jgi:hypothetical protein